MAYPITVFVLNIPQSMHWKGLWAMLRYHGEVDWKEEKALRQVSLLQRGGLGELISLRKNLSNVRCFGSMTILVSIKQQEKVDGMIAFERKEESVASEDESVIGAGLENMLGRRSDWEMEALKLLEKSNDRGESQNLSQQVCRLEKEFLGGNKAESREDKSLSLNEKRKIDRVIKKHRGKGIGDKENEVMNALLSYSDIINRKRVILKEAMKAWEVGKKLSISMKGDEREVVEDLMRLEGK
ncbi:hypothetical protein GOBAR_AA27030 [Gossypium barbadense]|uniref:Uncharacterized protein n=1 Tax=Gossypium barbadense TaxID=3634 RepID=A0A2P5WRB3_GOSBA|nr:hypothetical protein GOBAR_AA27030 [Gossypium barbadense]